MYKTIPVNIFFDNGEYSGIGHGELNHHYSFNLLNNTNSNYAQLDLVHGFPTEIEFKFEDRKDVDDYGLIELTEPINEVELDIDDLNVFKPFDIYACDLHKGILLVYIRNVKIKETEKFVESERKLKEV